MIKRSQELLDFFGLKLGDYIKDAVDNEFVVGTKYEVTYICGKGAIPSEQKLVLIDTKTRSEYPLSNLLDKPFWKVFKTKLSDKEKLILSFVGEEYEFITRVDGVLKVYFYENKFDGFFDGYRKVKRCETLPFEKYFKCIEEDVTYTIKDLLK